MKRFAFLILTCFVLNGCGDESYPDIIEDSLVRILGDKKNDFSGYVFYGNPRSGPGIGSLFYPSVLEGERPEAVMRNTPDRWWSEQVSDAEKQRLFKEMFFEGATGKVDANDTLGLSTNFGLALPLKKYLTDLGFDLKNQKGVKISIHADRIIQRTLLWDELSEKKNRGYLKDSVRKTIEMGNFVIIVSDWLIEGFEIDIAVDKSINPELSIALAKAPELIEGLNLNLNLSKSQDGEFLVRSTRPVVAAVLFKKPPKGVTLSSQVDPTKWETVVPSEKAWDNFQSLADY